MSGRIDIFISYKREERDLADRFSRALQAAGYTVVTDLNIQKATDFGEAIDGMIRAAKLVVVLWTPLSATSDWVRKEANEAERLKKYLGVVVRPITMDDLPFQVRTIEYLDISADESATGESKAVAEVRTLIGPAETTEEVAETRSADLRGDLEFFQVVDKVGRREGYIEYLEAYPAGLYVAEAREHIRLLTKPRWHRWLPSAAALTVVAAFAAVGIAWLEWQSGDKDLRQIEADLAAAETKAEDLDVEIARTKAKHAEQITQLEADRVRLTEELVAAKGDPAAGLEGKELEAYRLAESLIRNAKAMPWNVLILSGADIAVGEGDLTHRGDERLRHLTRLPPEIADLTALQELYLADTQVANVAPLAGLTSLNMLALDDTKVVDLSPLASLNWLRGLCAPTGGCGMGKDEVQALIHTWKP